jgi:hypothetical protein
LLIEGHPQGCEFRVLNSPPILEGVAGRSPASASKTGDALTGMCFDYTAFRHFMETRNGVLIGPEPRDGLPTPCRFDSCCLSPSWMTNQPGSWNRPETELYPQGYGLRVACHPPFRVGRWARVGLQNRPCRVRFLDGPPYFFRCGLLVSQRRSERCPRTFDSYRLSQHDHRWVAGIPAWL